MIYNEQHEQVVKKRRSSRRTRASFSGREENRKEKVKQHFSCSSNVLQCVKHVQKQMNFSLFRKNVPSFNVFFVLVYSYCCYRFPILKTEKNFRLRHLRLQKNKEEGEKQRLKASMCVWFDPKFFLFFFCCCGGNSMLCIALLIQILPFYIFKFLKIYLFIYSIFV